MATGYTLNGIAGRIRDLETKTNGAYYVALCWLAMARNSGKGSKKLLEGKVFGQDKPTSTFRNAWRIADKAFAEGFHAGHRTAVSDMALDEAIDFAVTCLDAHKTALGVSNMKDYEEVCKYADKDAVPAAVAEADDEPQGETETEPQGETANEPPAERDTMEIAVAAMMALSPIELIEFAAKVQARIMDLAETEQAQQKQAA